jgi:TolB-like protein/tetratricopeptide (TPR) repeat protein
MSNRAPSTPSVALLPFTADSSDADARKLASATHDAVAHTLSQGAFAVSTIEGASQGGRAPADFLISGQSSTAPNKVMTTVRMEDTAHHVVVFSHQFEATRAETWDLPERIGAQVAAQLSWTAPLIAMERRHPSDPAIVASLLQSSAAGLNSVGSLHDYETARRLAEKAPNSPLAQNSFAFSTAFALGDLPREQRAEAVAVARRAADRAVVLAPEFGDNYTPWCLLRSEQQRVQCEDRLRAAMRADPDAPFVNWFLAYLILNQVGRNREAAELASLSLAHDQYMPYKIGLQLRTLEIAGRSDEAAELYKQSSRWWPDNEPIKWYRLSGIAARGDFEAMQRFDDQVGGQKQLKAVLSAINRKSLPAVRTVCATADDVGGIECMLALARFGDFDAAYRLADRLYPSRRGRNSADENRIWLDNPGALPVFFLTSSAASPMRRDPRYVALADRVGLLDYWRSGRLPDFCRGPRPEPVCTHIGRR